MKSRRSRQPPQFRPSQPLISTPSPRKTWHGTMNTMFALFIGLTIVGGVGSSVVGAGLDMSFVDRTLVNKNLGASYFFIESFINPHRDIKNEKFVYKTGSNLVPTYTVADDGYAPLGRKRAVLGASDEKNEENLSPMRPIAPELPQGYILPTTDNTTDNIDV